MLVTHEGHSTGAGRPRQAALSAAVIGAAVAACYANSLHVPFRFDDLGAIVENRHIRTLWPLTEAMSAPANTSGTGRPLLNLSFAINYALGGLDPVGYHIGSILIHIAAAWLIFGIVRRLLRGDGTPDGLRRSADGLALSIALVWSVHPLHTQAITYLVQRAEALAAMFYLAAVYAFVRSVGTARPHGWQAASVAMCFLGTMAKEVASTAPLVIFAIDAIVVSRGRWMEPLRRRGIYYAGLLLSLVPLAIIMANAPRGETAGFSAELVFSFPRFVMAQPGVLLTYLRLAIAPVNLCFDYSLEPPEHWREAVLPGIGLALLLGATVWLLLRRQPAAIFGVWFFVILSPTHSVVPVSELMWEYRMYLPLAGVAALAVLLVHRWTFPASPAGEAGAAVSAPRRALRIGMVAAATCVLATLTHLRNRVYATDLALWEDTVQKSPGSARAQCFLAFARHEVARSRMSEGDLAAAEATYRAAIAASHLYDPPYVSLGVLLSDRGEHEEGLALIRRAAELKPTSASAHYSMGVVLARLGRDDEAAASYRRALELDAEAAEPAYNLGNLALRSGDLDEAEAWYRAALARQPRHVQSTFNLAGILHQRGDEAGARACIDRAFEYALRQADEARSLRRPREVVEALRLAVQARPDSAEARARLAAALRDIGRREEAAAEATEALRLDASHAPARRLLAELKP